MLDVIRNAWSWIGLDAIEVIATNDFGNVIVKARDGSFWRICPEEWSCKSIASDASDFALLSVDDDFQLDWKMSPLVELAREKLGVLDEGRVYCLKMPAIIGGAYGVDNFGTVPLRELIEFSGDMAEQIKDVADGEYVELGIINLPKNPTS